MKKTIIILFILLLLPFSVSAEQSEFERILDETVQRGRQVESFGFHFAENVENIAKGSVKLSFAECFNRILDLFFGEIKNNTTLLIKMVVLSILTGILTNLEQNMPGDVGSNITYLACFSVIAGLSVTIVSELSNLATKTIDSLFIFMQSLIPLLATLVASGSIPAVAGFSPLLFASMQGFTYVCKSVFLPMIMVITSLSVINALSGRFHITRLLDFSRQAVKWGIGLLLTLFVGILSIQGFSASFGSKLAGKTVKYALCNFVPIVGSVLAESAEAVSGSLKIIRGAVGISGVLALISFCILPLIKILATSLLYRFAAGISEPVTDKRIVKLFVDLAGNMTLIFSILLMVCVMFLISIAILCILIV